MKDYLKSYFAGFDYEVGEIGVDVGAGTGSGAGGGGLQVGWSEVVADFAGAGPGEALRGPTART